MPNPISICSIAVGHNGGKLAQPLVETIMWEAVVIKEFSIKHVHHSLLHDCLFLLPCGACPPWSMHCLWQQGELAPTLLTYSAVAWRQAATHIFSILSWKKGGKELAPCGQPSGAKGAPWDCCLPQQIPTLWMEQWAKGWWPSCISSTSGVLGNCLGPPIGLTGLTAMTHVNSRQLAFDTNSSSYA